MSSRPELPPETIDFLESLEWHILPQDHGQIVSRSYAVDVWYLYRRHHDRSSGETTYDRAELDYDDPSEFAPWNGLLPNHGEWEDCE